MAASESYKTDRIFTLEPGETAVVDNHSFTYTELAADRTSRRDRTFARIVIDGGSEYQPARTRYRQQGMVVGTPSVKPGITEDLYLVLDEVPPDPGRADPSPCNRPASDHVDLGGWDPHGVWDPAGGVPRKAAPAGYRTGRRRPGRGGSVSVSGKR